MFHVNKTLSSHLSFLQTLDDDPVPTGKDYQWQNRPVSEWTNQQVCHWLMGMNMDQYTPEFTAKGVDGLQLLHLDSDKLKVNKTGRHVNVFFPINKNIFIYFLSFSKQGLFLIVEIILPLTATLWPGVCVRGAILRSK